MYSKYQHEQQRRREQIADSIRRRTESPLKRMKGATEADDRVKLQKLQSIDNMLRRNSKERIDMWVSKLNPDSLDMQKSKQLHLARVVVVVDIDKFEKKFGSLKYKTDNFNFRERVPDREMSPKPFNTSNYLSSAEKIKKALVESQLMSSDKYVNKREFKFRPTQPLQTLRKQISAAPQSDAHRVQELINNSGLLENGHFDAAFYRRADVHRPLVQPHSSFNNNESEEPLSPSSNFGSRSRSTVVRPGEQSRVSLAGAASEIKGEPHLQVGMNPVFVRTEEKYLDAANKKMALSLPL